MSINTSMITRLGQARSFLFVPGNRPDRFEKAIRSGADVVILDLEDGVAQTDKIAARANIEGEWLRLQQFGIPVVVRVNSPSSKYGEGDLAWLSRLNAPAAVMLPKVEDDGQISFVRQSLEGMPVLPVIESAAGYAAVHQIAADPGVVRLVLGHIDFMADTGIVCSEDEPELSALRFEIAMATRLSRLAPPVDGATIQISDLNRLRRDMRRSLQYGFGAKICIHPSQVAVVHEVCAPTEEELQWAMKVLRADEASGGAPVQVEGRLVELPLVLQARRTLARAGGLR